MEERPQNQGSEQEPEEAPKRPTSRFKRILKWVIIGAVLIAAGLYVTQWYIWSRTHVSTDDAYVHTHIHQIAPRVSGTVVGVYVDDNDLVKKGQLLVRLDPTDYEVALKRAMATHRRQIEIVQQKYASVDAAKAGLNLAKAQYDMAKKDYERYKYLFETEVIPEQQYDNAKTNLEVADARVKNAEEMLNQAIADLGGDLTTSPEERSIVREARQQQSQATLNLAYTNIYAPTDGYITSKNVEVGNKVNYGQPLMAILPIRNEEIWIEANYKETQLKNLRVGNPVEVEVGAYPGKVFHGVVQSLQSGTGAALSLLPPENATGNWVKVVQRLPVRIFVLDETDPDHLLRVGLSVKAMADTSERLQHIPDRTPEGIHLAEEFHY
jgi:membrane fusion protein (multidrug efflux system)